MHQKAIPSPLRAATVRALQIGSASLALWIIIQVVVLALGGDAWHRDWLIFALTLVVSFITIISEGYRLIRPAATSMATWMGFYALVIATGATVAFV